MQTKVRPEPELKQVKTEETDLKIWLRRVDGELNSVLFATSFSLPTRTDLSGYVKTLPEGVVICDSGIIAGIEHVESILLETKEHWKRNEKLVRNGSIEILMRLTCKSQITEAIEASGIKEANSVALLGLLSSENDVKKTVNEFVSEVETTGQDLKFLEIDRQKASKLKRLHKLPNNLTNDQLQIALQEKSVLLIFSK